MATNTDATFPTPHGLEPGAGALVAYLEVGSGRKAEAAGKPEQAMAAWSGPGSAPRAWWSGDRPDTDGLFATRLEAAFALVLSGVTKASDLPVQPAPSTVGDDLAAVVAHRLEG